MEEVFLVLAAGPDFPISEPFPWFNNARVRPSSFSVKRTGMTDFGQLEFEPWGAMRHFITDPPHLRCP